MNKALSSTLLIAACILAAVPVTRIFAENNQETPAELQWSEDYASAIEQAKKENKRILIDFSGSDWCHWCTKMDKDVLSTKTFKDYADSNLVLVLADFPAKKPQPYATAAQNKKLRDKYGIRGFPTFLVLGPDEKELARHSGYMRGGPKNFIAFLETTEYAVKNGSDNVTANDGNKKE